MIDIRAAKRVKQRAEALRSKMSRVHPDDIGDGVRNKITDLLIDLSTLIESIEDEYNTGDDLPPIPPREVSRMETELLEIGGAISPWWKGGRADTIHWMAARLRHVERLIIRDEKGEVVTQGAFNALLTRLAFLRKKA